MRQTHASAPLASTRCPRHSLLLLDGPLDFLRTLLETTARVPLFVRDPSHPESFGKHAAALVENVDIYPTILDLVGLHEYGSALWPPLEGT